MFKNLRFFRVDWWDIKVLQFLTNGLTLGFFYILLPVSPDKIATKSGASFHINAKLKKGWNWRTKEPLYLRLGMLWKRKLCTFYHLLRYLLFLWQPEPIWIKVHHQKNDAMEYLTQQQYMIESQNKYFIYVAFTNNSKVIYVIKLVSFTIVKYYIY